MTYDYRLMTNMTPSFLFYSQDFLIGTLTLPMEDRGKYITLLCCMHEHGRLTEQTVINLVGEVSEKLRSKFKTDDNGLWYNQRLEKEIKDREKFVRSRRNNGKRGGLKKKVKIPSRQTELAEVFTKSETKRLRQVQHDNNDNDLFGSKPLIPPMEGLRGAVPLPEQVKACFITYGLSPIEAEYETLKFMAYYTGSGWKTNKGNPIINWKAAVANWNTRRNQFTKNKQPKTLTEQWLE